ncbi:cell division topological specificity factor MinE [bacterium]|nr:MAG: cell division topological specificity factor MinE [bacterium]
MSWLDAILRFFRPTPSGVVAKERLRLVLLSDRIHLAPDVIDQLRGDLIATISRYMEIDEVGLDVTFETRENDVALLANIPIKAVRARPLPPPAPVVPQPEEAVAQPEEAVALAEVAAADGVAAAEAVTVPARRKRVKAKGNPEAG